MKFFLRIYNWRVFGKDHGIGWWANHSVYVPFPFSSWSLAVGFAPPVFGPWFMFVKTDDGPSVIKKGDE